MAEAGLGEFGGCCLDGAKFAEGYKELVIYCATVINQDAEDGLDSFDAGVVEFGAGVRRVGELLFGAIDDG